ncbi:M16 family metallopeptidase [Pseudopontixanthobacter vadosimaris]|uniref:M16 family metallopeptidase n=1 Tax=Pseudopontixanthobacter vadosimaris TaxID=2726450 RepID=UPI0014728E8C|nr:M16 family metallopeptidase [Pseudopontixanthobacter vadosimaris]
MTIPSRAKRQLALLPLVALFAIPAHAQVAPQQVPQQVTIPAAGPEVPAPRFLQTGETPWLYRGSDVPQDAEWNFGEIDNGLRYAVRENGVPPGQVSIRIRIDAGSLYEKDAEQGFAHLIEHLVFRESRYLKDGEAIPRWQRLGATFGSDTNAETSPTHTVYKLDLPGATPASLDESFRLLSGMVREPALSTANLAAEVPIVLAEKRERGGAANRVAEETRRTLFAGQRLAERLPIGTEATLRGATQKAVRNFHRNWYRPENTTIVVAGDADPAVLAGLVEKYFADWQVAGEGPDAPAFGDPVAPDASAAHSAADMPPIGATSIVVESDLPRTLTYAIMRPWRAVDDTIVYNEGLLLDSVAQAIINRRLESRARAGGSYLYAQAQQQDVSRSADATFVSLAPISEDWHAALADVRGVIADALAQPPTQEEIDRELAEFEIAFVSGVEQRSVMAGSRLADNLVNAVDIREAVAAPEVILSVFRNMKARFTPAEVLDHTRDLFRGNVTRAVYATPVAGEAGEGALTAALSAQVAADGGARLAAQDISFADLPPIGEPGTIVANKKLGVLDIDQVTLDNGVKAILWANNAEPGRVAVSVRFGSGYRAFAAEDAPYAALGQYALVGSGLGELGQEELDRISTGRRMGFNFGIDDAVFTFGAQTRGADLADQLYLFAAKLGMPRWDENPVIRARAAARLAYDGFATSPGGVLNRDLNYLLRARDPRFATPDPATLSTVTPEGFREVWEPLLKQGPVEVSIFGDFDREETLEALRRTFGALPEREPIPAEALARVPAFPAEGTGPVVLNHRGDANQAAAVVAWPTGGGVPGIRESRQLEILTQLFDNRLMDAMRERAGASYAPQVSSNWPVDLESGGILTAIAQLKPEDVPAFFAAADEIAADLAANPATADELARVTEPLRQTISRASTGNTFWLYQLEGAASDPRRVAMLRTLLNDYSQTTPERMQDLARRYLASRPGWRVAVIPKGQELSSAAE